MSSATTESSSVVSSLSKVFRSESLRKRFEQSLKRARKEKREKMKPISRTVEYDPKTGKSTDVEEQITIGANTDTNIWDS